MKPPVPPTVPPSISITNATPRLAPVSIPRIDGPANGLLNTVCNISPEVASAAPANSAVTACGNLDSSTINDHEACPASPPVRMPSTARNGIGTDPRNRLAANSTATQQAAATIYRTEILTAASC